MIRFAFRICIAASFALVAVPVFAQTPGVDENDCKPSPLMSRMPGCGVWECSKKDFDAFDVVINKAGEAKTLEGEVEHMKFVCPASASQLQLQRNAEAALRKSGYTIVYSGKHQNHDNPVVTAKARNGSRCRPRSSTSSRPTNRPPSSRRWRRNAQVRPRHRVSAKSGKLDVYGITFATGQATSHAGVDQRS